MNEGETLIEIAEKDVERGVLPYVLRRHDYNDTSVNEYIVMPGFKLKKVIARKNEWLVYPVSDLLFFGLLLFKTSEVFVTLNCDHDSDSELWFKSGFELPGSGGVLNPVVCLRMLCLKYKNAFKLFGLQN